MNLTSVVSTFSGCGGSSLGYKKAKCKVLLAIDFEDNAVKTYKLNFPKTPIWKANIREITGKKILDAIGMKKGELDIFDGSPPCTSFSPAGKREKGWGKVYKHMSETEPQRTDDLFFEFIRLIKEIKPKSFIAENVRGLIQGRTKGYFNKILRAMREAGYKIRVFDINAKNFDVPQSRPRVFFIGIRNDLAPNEWPKLETKKPISFYAGTKDLEIPENELKEVRSVMNRNSINQYLPMMKQGESMSKYHPKGNQFGYVRASYNNPCPTITAGGYMQIFHPIDNRALTVTEARRLSSFPDNYKFLSLRDGWIRIGNSVPPNLMMNMAKYVRSIIC